MKEEQLVAAVEEVYWTTGLPPTEERLSEKLAIPVEEVRQALANPKLQATLRSRGVSIDPTDPTYALTAVQQLAVNVMVNSADKRTERAKLEDLNGILQANGLEQVTIHQWAGWKRSPAVQTALNLRAREMFKADEWKFHNALTQGTEERNPAIVKMMGQRLGLLHDGSTTVNVQVDLHVLIDKLFNVLTEVITDPDLLVRIGERLERELDEPGNSKHTPTALDVTEVPEKVRRPPVVSPDWVHAGENEPIPFSTPLPEPLKSMLESKVIEHDQLNPAQLKERDERFARELFPAKATESETPTSEDSSGTETLPPASEAGGLSHF